MKWLSSSAVLVLSILVPLSQKASALNGTAFAFADTQVIYQVKAAVGALGYMETFKVKQGDTEVSEQQWKVIGNAIYIGEHEGNAKTGLTSGSALLAAAGVVTDEEGKLDPELRKKLKLRFGQTVSDKQNVSNVRRIEFRLVDAEIVIQPGHLPSKLMKPGSKRPSLALILLPYKLDEDFAPMRLIRSNEYIAIKSPYKTFGHGSLSDEGALDTQVDKSAVEINPFEIAVSSGFLRWAPVILDSEWKSQSLFRGNPMPEEDYKILYSSIERTEDAWVDGPCHNDLGAPLVLDGGVLPRPGEDQRKARQIVLVGVFNAKDGTCERHGKKDANGKPKSPMIVYLDLRDKIYQDFIRQYVTEMPQ